jgi:enamine deaminase RidA (YjgF/YER057c/UK114 family)
VCVLLSISHCTHPDLSSVGVRCQAGTSKDNILSAQVWLKDINTHFDAMNVEWNKWAGDSPAKGVRACVESALAR